MTIRRDFGFAFLCIILRFSWRDCPTLSKFPDFHLQIPWFSLPNSLTFTSKFPDFQFLHHFQCLHYSSAWFVCITLCTDVTLVMSKNPTILNTLYVELNAIKQMNAMRGEVTSEFIRDSLRNRRWSQIRFNFLFFHCIWFLLPFLLTFTTIWWLPFPSYSSLFLP